MVEIIVIIIAIILIIVQYNRRKRGNLKIHYPKNETSTSFEEEIKMSESSIPFKNEKEDDTASPIKPKDGAGIR